MGRLYGEGTYGEGTYGGLASAERVVRLATATLGLHAEITKPDGSTYRWDGTAEAGSIPVGVAFSTKRMEGFASASLTLRRRIDLDWPDVELYDELALVGADGRVAYEGFVSAHPRQLDADGHSIQVEATGWMASARHRKFRAIYVDRDLSRWTDMAVARKASLLTGATPYSITAPETQSDVSAGQPALVTKAVGAWAFRADSEATYDAGPGIGIGSVYYAWKRGATVVNTDALWSWLVRGADNDTLTTGLEATSELRAAGPGTGTLTFTVAKRFANVAAIYTSGPAGGDGVEYPIFWTCLAVYGDHGLTTHGTEDATTAKGVLASDAIAHIAQNWCPRLSTAGVQATNYPIPHLAFTDQTDPYDAFLEINKHHLWDLAVWERKTLVYGPVDLTDYDWEIRLDDPGVTVELQGDSAESLANGIVVEFDNVQTGKKDVLLPTDHDELADSSIDNPVNRHGLEVWTEVSLSSPTTQDAALQIGRGLLAEFNQPKGPGTISFSGYIRDREGNLHPGDEVRATDRVAITDHPNDRPRLITETSWNDQTFQGQIAVDSTVKRMDAFLDRVATAIRAGNLTQAS